MKVKNPKILFIHATRAPFIQNDLEMLSKHFDVRVLDLTPFSGSLKKKLKYSPEILLKMVRGILWSDITFTWFADIHAFLAVLLSKIFRKKSIVVVGGYEVVYAPEIGYGGMINPRKARMIKFILKNADKVIAVSQNGMKEILRWVDRDIELIYNCVDTKRFRLYSKKEKIVITVGGIDKTTLKRKGIEVFVKAARHLPHVPFVVIGGWRDENIIEYLKSIAPKNVKFAGFVSQEELLKWYQRAKVYCQLSFHENFGVAVAEAMACGCIPVVTDRGALPEVVGDCGFYVPYGDEKKVAEVIKKALDTPEDLSVKARESGKIVLKREKRN